ncbi:uncharacterized protein LOC127835907 [Dreissena polymorpha]|uniref:uncharacterized protein LOC127835907 n=1 Tax=Dreissena polymorpha TaxID=45954 RepID=UPI002264E516|nr:uncharacterized protein LOC127835907 [Dreissena polymorpha]
MDPDRRPEVAMITAMKAIRTPDIDRPIDQPKYHIPGEVNHCGQHLPASTVNMRRVLAENGAKYKDVDDLYDDRENGYSDKRRYDDYYNRIENEYYSVPDDYYDAVDDALYDVDDDDYEDCDSDHMCVKYITDTTSEDSSFGNNREDDYDVFLVKDYICNEENFYDMDEASENDIDSEHSDSAGDEDFSWGNDELVNFTYTGSDWDYNCRDKQYCYEIDNECTDDEDYYNGKELDVVHDSDDDGSINGDKRRYDDFYNRLDTDYYSVLDDYFNRENDEDDEYYDPDYDFWFMKYIKHTTDEDSFQDWSSPSDVDMSGEQEEQYYVDIDYSSGEET